MRIIKWIVSFALMVILLVAPIHSISLFSKPTIAPEPNPLKGLKSYRIYYDVPTPSILNDMKQLDLVILNPLFYTSDQIKEIQSNGTKVYGYISLMEQGTWDASFISELYQNDLLDKKRPIPSPKSTQDYIMDMTSKHYQVLLLREVYSQIIQKKLDGIFLDTIGYIDDYLYNNPDTSAQQRKGVEQFIRSAKSLDPHLSLIQNWGFPTFQTTTASLLDGIMWENFDCDTLLQNSWSQQQLKRLLQMKVKYGVQILTVSTKNKSLNTEYASSHGLISTYTDKSYNSW